MNTIALSALTLLGSVVAGRAGGQEPQLDLASLGRGRYASMHTLLEKTIFKVDVLTLEVRFGEVTTHRLEALATRGSLTADLADSIAATAVAAQDVWAHIRFERNVSLGQFLNGIRASTHAAQAARIISDDEAEQITQQLPTWYRFLSQRGVKEGDEMFYRIRGDTLRTVYRGADGQIMLDQTDEGQFRRLAVLGGYFAPRSDFRKGLITSLFADR